MYVQCLMHDWYVHNVSNAWLQSQCSDAHGCNLNVPYSSNMADGVLAALFFNMGRFRHSAMGGRATSHKTHMRLHAFN